MLAPFSDQYGRPGADSVRLCDQYWRKWHEPRAHEIINDSMRGDSPYSSAGRLCVKR